VSGSGDHPCGRSEAGAQVPGTAPPVLSSDLATLDRDLDRLVAAAAPTLCALKGVGTDVAGAVLVAAGDKPERLRSEGAFANLCGVAPLPASSGKIGGRHRLNHGGDRRANCALWRVVIVRLATHEPTRNYMARRTQEGMSKPEIIRCLKRYVAREIYRELMPRAVLAAAA
jgi:transposase